MWPRIWCVLDQTRQIHKPSNKHQGIDYRFFTGFEMMLTQLNCKVLTSTDPKTHKYIYIYSRFLIKHEELTSKRQPSKILEARFIFSDSFELFNLNNQKINIIKFNIPVGVCGFIFSQFDTKDSRIMNNYSGKIRNLQ